MTRERKITIALLVILAFAIGGLAGDLLHAYQDRQLQVYDGQTMFCRLKDPRDAWLLNEDTIKQVLARRPPNE